MLTGCCNRLQFDDYVSDWFELDNRIVQGDLLLMILYLFYNTDMLDIAHGHHKLCLGYVDDMALIASADTFENAHHMLGNCHGSSLDPPCPSEAKPPPLTLRPISNMFRLTSNPTGSSVCF